MSNREHEITQTIANLVSLVSAQTNLSIEDSMNFVYNSDTWNMIIGNDDNCLDYQNIESALMKELKFG